MDPALPWTSIYEKFYDAELALATYFHPDAKWTEDSILQPLNKINQWFISANKKADICIHYNGAICIYNSFPACDFFKEIIVIDCLETSVQYVKRWLKNDPKSFNWTETFTSLYEREEERKMFIKKEEKAKELIRQVIKADLAESGPVAPTGVPQADVIISTFFLCFLCKDMDSFTTSVKDMSSLLKVGGHLLMHLPIGCTYFYINHVRFPTLCLEEDSVIRVLSDLGYTIKEKQRHPRMTVGQFCVVDFSYIWFVDAFKECEVQ